MSTNVILIAIGTVVFLAGLFKLGKGQSGGVISRNFGITFGGSMAQKIRAGNIAPDPAGGRKADWIGLAIAGLGFLTALAGWLKG